MELDPTEAFDADEDAAAAPDVVADVVDVDFVCAAEGRDHRRRRTNRVSAFAAPVSFFFGLFTASRHLHCEMNARGGKRDARERDVRRATVHTLVWVEATRHSSVYPSLILG